MTPATSCKHEWNHSPVPGLAYCKLCDEWLCAPTRPIADNDHIESLCRFARDYELESIEAAGVKIVKRYHRIEAPKTEPKEPPQDLHGVDDEVLFHSSMEPRISVEDLAHMADKQAGREPQ